MNKYLGLFIIALMALLWGCNDGTIIGEDLVNGEEIDLQYDDDFQLSAKVLKGDSVATFRRGLPFATSLLGQVKESIFGSYSSELYLSFTASANNFAPDYKDAEIDSVVLQLEYDTSAFYGHPNSLMNFEVYRLTEDFSHEDTIFSNESFDVEMSPLGSKSFVPSGVDSIWLKYRDAEVTDSMLKVSPRFRIALDPLFGTELIEDTAAIKSDTVLSQHFIGFKIVSTAPDQDRMIGFNLLRQGATNSLSRLIVYYTQLTTQGFTPQSYEYTIRPSYFSHFDHDYDDSTVKDILEVEDGGQEVVYVQCMAGVNTEIQLPDLSALKGYIVNSAQLVLTVVDNESQYLTTTYPPHNRFLISKYNKDGKRTLVDDITKGSLTFSNALQLLDGRLRKVDLGNGETVKQVKFNITDYIRKVIEGKETDRRVVITPFGRQESAKRTIFYGADAPEHRIKLRIAYTKI